MAALFRSAVRKGAQAGRKARAAAERPELLRNVRSRERRKAREKEPLTAEGRAAQAANVAQILPGARSLSESIGGSNTPYRIRAMAASTMGIWLLGTFYFVQFLFWVLGMLGIILEVVPLANFVLPGTEIYLVSYVVIATMGILGMFYMAFVYSVRGIRWFDGVKGLGFAFSLAGYLLIFLNIFPWIVLWMLLVIFAKVEEPQ